MRVRARARACVRVRVRVRAREYHSASHLTQPVRNRPDALCPTSAHTNHTCDRRTHEPHMYRAAMPPIIPATHRHIPRYVPRYTPIFIATCPPPSPTPHAPGRTDKDKTGTKPLSQLAPTAQTRHTHIRPHTTRTSPSSNRQSGQRACFPRSEMMTQNISGGAWRRRRSEQKSSAAHARTSGTAQAKGGRAAKGGLITPSVPPPQKIAPPQGGKCKTPTLRQAKARAPDFSRNAGPSGLPQARGTPIEGPFFWPGGRLRV